MTTSPSSGSRSVDGPADTDPVDTHPVDTDRAAASPDRPGGSSPTPRASARFAPFDGIRAVAALLVFAIHINNVKFPGGWVGVELFFALSGYLITSLLLAEHEKTGRIALGPFYLRRVLRLLPALLAMVVIVVPIGALAGSREIVADGLATATYTMDIYGPIIGTNNLLVHGWSLAVEEQFYIVWPVLLVVGLRRGWNMPGVAAALAVAGAAIGAFFAAVEATPSVRVDLTPFPHLPVILAGVLLAFAVRRGSTWVAALGGWWAPAAAAVVGLAVLLKVDDDSHWLYYGGFVALGLVSVLLIGHLVARPGGPLARVLSFRPLVWLGERSYGFYLWHLPVVEAVRGLDPDGRLPLAPVVLVVSLVMTELSWLAVERPFLRLKRRVSAVALNPATAR